MAGNFTVDPGELRERAKSLRTLVADAFSDQAAKLRTGGEIDAPGFGIALSPLEAGYIQRLDFLTEDVEGAADVCRKLSDLLDQTAGQYERAENLNVAGFSMTGTHGIGYGEAFGQTGLADMATDGTAGGIAMAAGLTVVEIMAVMATMGACAALCPTFIPAVIGAGLFVANIGSISEAASALSLAGQSLRAHPNVTFDKITTAATAKWTGEGRDAYVDTTTTIKAHLDELADYVKTLGEALQGLQVALVALWLALAGMAGPFLVWLIATRAAEAIPGAAAVLEPVIEISGAAMSASVATILAAVVAVGGLLVTLLTGLGKDFAKLMALPDAGQAGVPDLTEFHVGRNFAAG